MKRYSIEWSGIITRDIGWDEVEANSPDEARDKYLKAIAYLTNQAAGAI
jgi:hypothetical protein